MPRQQKRYSVRVARRSGFGLSGTTRSFSTKAEALAYAKKRRNPVDVYDNKEQTNILSR